MLAETMIKCPYCSKIFWITEEEQYNNETFECHHCHLSNAGCIETDEYGVLIGVSQVDYELLELLKG